MESLELMENEEFMVSYKIFKIMGDNRFMAQEMVKLAQEITMKEAPEDALSIVLRTYFGQKIAKSREKIREFEERYGVDVETFYDKLGTEIPLSLEYEGDYLEWDFELAKLKSLEEKYRGLEKEQNPLR